MEPELELLKARAARAFQVATPQQVAERYRAIVGPTSEAGLVAEALDALRSGNAPTPLQLAALEDAIRSFRPALLVRDGAVPGLPADAVPAFPGWDSFRESVRPFLRAVGRIESLRSKPAQQIGTGFLLRHTLLVTNRHVLEALSSGTGKLARGMARVNFAKEYQQVEDEPAIDIVGTVAEHAELDLALLEIDATQLTRARAPLVLSPMPAAEGVAIAVLGYPAEDGERNPAFVSAAFSNKFGVKRVSPGEVMKVFAIGFHHDCSTLGGNSGSPIVAVEDARVVGVHFQGRFAARNSAVNAAALQQFIAAQEIP